MVYRRDARRARRRMAEWTPFGPLLWRPAPPSFTKNSPAGSQTLYVKIAGQANSQFMIYVPSGKSRNTALRAAATPKEPTVVPPPPALEPRKRTSATLLNAVAEGGAAPAAAPSARGAKRPKYEDEPIAQRKGSRDPNAKEKPDPPQQVATLPIGANVRYIDAKEDERKGLFIVHAVTWSCEPTAEYTLRGVPSAELRYNVKGKDLQACTPHQGKFAPPRLPTSPKDVQLQGRAAVEREFGGGAGIAWGSKSSRLRPKPASERVGRHTLPGDARCGGSLLLPGLVIEATGESEDEGRLGKMPSLVMGHGGMVMFWGTSSTYQSWRTQWRSARTLRIQALSLRRLTRCSASWRHNAA